MSLLKNLLFPPTCVACRDLLAPNTEEKTCFCKSCLSLWKQATLFECDACRQPIQRCVCMPPLMEKAKCRELLKCVHYIPGDEQRPQNQGLYAIKNGESRDTVCFFAHQMSEVLQKRIRAWGIAKEDLLVAYIPRSRRAIKQNDIDQARELSRLVAEETGLAWIAPICRLSSQNRSQKQLHLRARIDNAKCAYAPAENVPDLSGKTVVLIDDIVTTGASMAACARLLRQMGAKEVVGLVVALDLYAVEGPVG